MSLSKIFITISHFFKLFRQTNARNWNDDLHIDVFHVNFLKNTSKETGYISVKHRVRKRVLDIFQQPTLQVFQKCAYFQILKLSKWIEKQKCTMFCGTLCIFDSLESFFYCIRWKWICGRIHYFEHTHSFVHTCFLNGYTWKICY